MTGRTPPASAVTSMPFPSPPCGRPDPRRNTSPRLRKSPAASPRRWRMSPRTSCPSACTSPVAGSGRQQARQILQPGPRRHPDAGSIRPDQRRRPPAARRRSAGPLHRQPGSPAGQHRHRVQGHHGALKHNCRKGRRSDLSLALTEPGRSDATRRARNTAAAPNTYDA